MKENLKNRREAAKNMRAAEDNLSSEETKESAKGISVESMSTAS